MGDAITNNTPNGDVLIGNRHEEEEGNSSLVIDIFPLSNYYFGSKHPIPFKDESLHDRVRRMKSNYDARGLRTCVEAVMLVELFKHPHLLLLQVRNAIFKLPGGRVRPDESDADGLRRKLSRKLSSNADETDWEVGECLGVWWRPDFEALLYPYLPPNVKMPKECIKLYLVKLSESRQFITPKNLKLIAVPLCQIHENKKLQRGVMVYGVKIVVFGWKLPHHHAHTRMTYGQIISGVPQLLSKFSFNIVDS